MSKPEFESRESDYKFYVLPAVELSLIYRDVVSKTNDADSSMQAVGDNRKSSVQQAEMPKVFLALLIKPHSEEEETHRYKRKTKANTNAFRLR